ncbi:MAG: hypothetical protein KDA21_06855 [Phycisphaerales bacterium]|nr:hypothetical protein [Phycisphaerales bacterium]
MKLMHRRSGWAAAMVLGGLLGTGVATSLRAGSPGAGATNFAGLSPGGNGYTLKGRFSIQLCHDTKGFNSRLPAVIHGVSEVSLLDQWVVFRVETKPASTMILPRENVILLQVDE